MPLLKLRCETCEGELVLNPEKNVAKCTCCGVEYVIQQEVKNVYITNPVTNAQAKEWYEKGRSYERIKDRHESVKCYKEAYRLEPENGCYMYAYFRTENWVDSYSKMKEYYTRYPHMQEWEKEYLKCEGAFWDAFHRGEWERCEYAVEHISGFEGSYGNPIEGKVDNFVRNGEYDLVERLFSYDKTKSINVFRGWQIGRSEGDYYTDNYSYYDIWYLGERVKKENWHRLSKKPKPNKQIIELVKKYYDIPEEVKEEPNPIKRLIKKGICPVCGRKLGLLKSCRTNTKTWTPMKPGCNISFRLNMVWKTKRRF